MPTIKWNQTYSVNVINFDKQHQKLFEIINEFYDNLVIQSNDQLILKLVSGMRNYVQIHFHSEEEMMKLHSYPEFESHKQQHDSFIKKVKELEDRLGQGVTVISYEITSFLKDWIKNHILNTDKKYSDFFNKLGVN